MKGKLAKHLRRAVEDLGPFKPKAYQVVPHAVRQKEHRDPWQTKDDLPRFRYTTATVRLIPECARARYQRAKRIYRQLFA